MTEKSVSSIFKISMSLFALSAVAFMSYFAYGEYAKYSAEKKIERENIRKKREIAAKKAEEEKKAKAIQAKERRFTKSDYQKLVVFEDSATKTLWGTGKVSGYHYSHKGDSNLYYSPSFTYSKISGGSIEIKISNHTYFTPVTIKGTVDYKTKFGYLNNDRFSSSSCFLCYSISAKSQSKNFSITVAPQSTGRTTVYADNVRFGMRSLGAPVDKTTIKFRNIKYYVNGSEVR